MKQTITVIIITAVLFILFLNVLAVFILGRYPILQEYLALIPFSMISIFMLFKERENDVSTGICEKR